MQPNYPLMMAVDRNLLVSPICKELAQVWKHKQQAQQAIPKYADFLLEQIASHGQARVLIRRLHRLGDGQMEEETVETLVLVSEDFNAVSE